MADIRELNPERGRGAKVIFIRTTLALTNLQGLSSRDARELCGGTSLPPKTKEIYASRPWPNPSETETRPTDITRGGDFHILIYM